MNKEQLLKQIDTALNNGTLLSSDIKEVLNKAKSLDNQTDTSNKSYGVKKSKKLSASDILFYVAGILFYTAAMALVAQLWPQTGELTGTIIGLGLGALAWIYAAIILKRSLDSQILTGIFNATLLSASLLLLTGGVFLASQIGSSLSSNQSGYVAAHILAIIGLLHIVYAWLIKVNNKLPILFGAFLLIFTLSIYSFQYLMPITSNGEVYAIVGLILSAILASSTRALQIVFTKTPNIKSSFDGFAIFTASLILYINGYVSGYAYLWTAALILGVITLLYFSVIKQKPLFLKFAATFLVLAVIQIVFKYLTGLGTALSLLVAAASVVVVAIVAININNKYLKEANS